VWARAFRKGPAWTVLLVVAGEPSMNKRGAQVALVVSSLRPAGYTRETFQGRTAHALDAARVKALTDFAESARLQAAVPGIAVSLFTTDTVLFEGGFGVREIGKLDPVDADTLFMIASNTKSLSTLLSPSRIKAASAAWSSATTRSTSTCSTRPGPASPAEGERLARNPSSSPRASSILPWPWGDLP